MLPPVEQPSTNGKADIRKHAQSMWSSLLDGVAQGKKLPPKHVIVLGGDAEAQKEFLASISVSGNAHRRPDRHMRHQVPVANNFALGYTYLDVWDAEHDEILARLSIYFLSDPSSTFASLLQQLLDASTIPNTLVVLLLDWSNPFSWARELLLWTTLLRQVTAALEAEYHVIMREVMNGWRHSTHLTGMGPEAGAISSNSANLLPPGPGEWDEPIGLPMCVVCQKAEQVGRLEKEQGWKEADFDFIMQFLRTVLLKHGASLIYTTLSRSSCLRDLVYVSLGIPSVRMTDIVKANVIDRDKVLVPSNWDSWGKIRVLREGFETAKFSESWSRDLDRTEMQYPDGKEEVTKDTATAESVKLYEQILTRRSMTLPPMSDQTATQLQIECQPTEAFLDAQFTLLERMSSVESSGAESRRVMAPRVSHNIKTETLRGGTAQDVPVTEGTGPIHFNVGGIQVDAEDMLQRLRERQSHQTPEPESTWTDSAGGNGQNEALASFFAGLIKQSNGSAANSPNHR